MSYNNQQQQNKGGNEPWRSKDRHYCSICNAWMGSDRQSIMLHENGKKHREAVEVDLKKRRDDKLKKEKQKKDLDSVFASVNAAVGISVGGSSGGSNFGVAKPWEQYQTNTVAAQAVPSSQAVPTIIKKEPIKVTSSSSTTTVAKQKQKKQPEFDPNIGHYEIEGIIYLEGTIYANILEEGMPVQLWMGSTLATDNEKRDLRNYNNWKKMALLAKVVKKKKKRRTGEEDKDDGGKQREVSCHVSYLQNETDDDETIESNVSPSRIRLVLGSDPLLPGTLEEAHLALLGGEQIIQVKDEDTTNGDNNTTTSQVIDENTGLSSWSTTTIRKVSSQYEQNQEKKRKRQHEREVAEYKEKKEKELQARKMEEAKYANAHDSALGAYDIAASSMGGSEGKASRAYKGVDINKEMKVEVSDTARSLSKGMGSVAFKKKKVKKKKGNVRKTFADD